MSLNIVKNPENQEDLFQQMRENLIDLVTIEFLFQSDSVDVFMRRLTTTTEETLRRDYFVTFPNKVTTLSNPVNDIIFATQSKIASIKSGNFSRISQVPETHHLFSSFRDFVLSDIQFIKTGVQYRFDTHFLNLSSP